MDSRKRTIRVLVVDDSAVMRKLIPSLLDKDEEIEVVATAIDGDFAINKIQQMRPDVITLDVDMPRMDGITALGVIVSKHKIPVLMLSSLTTRDAALTMKALEMGAVDFICKPRVTGRMGEMGGELVAKIKAAARSTVIQPVSVPVPLIKTKKKPAPLARTAGSGKLIAIGASSGGPNALRYLLPRMPADIGAGIVVVQHMPESFTAVMAKWLDEICDIEVREARDGDLIAPGRALVAPGNAHLRVQRTALGPVVALERGTPVNGHMPSVDVLFRSVAREYGRHTTAVIMTGMGTDGAEGIGEIRKAGGHTMAQNKETCAIFGMPRVAIERGYVQQVGSLSDIANWLVIAAGKQEGSEEKDGKLN
jgi:two-component system, chemotaxis family, protein-glutamate methylesterase/glutaminase